MKIDYVKGDCLFTRINDVPRQYPYLTSNIETDVVIIGGGVTGAIAGYYFSKNNINTVLIERGRIAHGSTCITTSLLQYELDGNLASLLSYTSKEKVLKSYKLGLKALDEIAKFAEDYGNTFDYKKANSVLYTNKKVEMVELFNEYNVRKEAGLDVKYIESDQNPFDFELKAAVISIEGGAKIDPYKFTHSLLDASKQNGLEIYENTKAESLAYDNEGVTVNTQYGHTIKSKIVIAATGYDTSLFTKRNLGQTMSTTFNLATKPIQNLAPIYDDHIFRDNQTIYNYFRSTKDKRLVFGGYDIGFNPEINNEELCNRQCDKLEQMAKLLFPQYNIDIEFRYYGAFATTNDDMGFIGKDPDHNQIWYCLGYGANGILFAILGGMMLSELYLGNKLDMFDLFAVNRFCN